MSAEPKTRVEKPERHETEITRDTELAKDLGKRREYLLETMEELYPQYDRQRTDVERMQQELDIVSEKLSRLKELAGDDKAIKKQCGELDGTVLNLRLRLQDAMSRLRPIEARLLSLAAEKAALDNRKDDAVAAIEESVQLVEYRLQEMGDKEKEEIAEIEALITEISEALDTTVREIDDEDLSEQKPALTISSEAEGNLQALLSNAVERARGERTENTRLSREAVERQSEHLLQKGYDRPGPRGKRYIVEQVIDGEVFEDIDKEIEAKKADIVSMEKDKPKKALIGKGQKLKDWEARKKGTEDKLDVLTKERKEVESLQKELVVAQKKLQEGIDQKQESAAKSTKLVEALNGRLGPIINELDRANERTRETNRRYQRERSGFETELYNLNVTIGQLEIEDDHPIFKQAKELVERQEQAVQAAEEEAAA